MTDEKARENASHTGPPAPDADATQPSSDLHSAPSPTDASDETAAAAVEAAEQDLSNDADLKVKLEAMERQSQENYDRFLRVAAELDNFRKRKEREVSDLRKYANQSLLRELLLVVDNLERALDSSRNSDTEPLSLTQGIEMTLKELLKIFDQFGVKPIVALQQPFDPNLHEAVMQEPSDHVPPNTVVRELQKGYLLRDRLLRPAMVTVSKESD